MDSIRKFFDKKKKDAKFKVAGSGKRLDSTSSKPPSRGTSQPTAVQSRSVPTAEAQAAAAAAVSRYETKVKRDNVDWSLQAIRARAKKELELEKKMAEMNTISSETPLKAAASLPDNHSSGAVPMYAVQGVFFHCPLLGPQVCSFEDIRGQIREFLYSQIEEDKGVAACLIIHTCNKNKEKITVCIETLCKYIENITTNPEEEKYQKIRKSNRAYEDRIAPMEGTTQFLQAAGFIEQRLPFNDTEHDFWVFEKENLSDLSHLEGLRDALVSAEPLRPQLDRSSRVLLPTEASKRIELPPEFFTVTAEELKKENEQKRDDFERSQMLLTKAARERMELREMRKYRFALMRIRYPDGIILQGTFGIKEKFGDVLSFVRDHLVHDWRPFFLSLSGGGKVTDEEQTLYELRLLPAVVFNFLWDPSVADPDLNDSIYLKEESLMLLQSME